MDQISIEQLSVDFSQKTTGNTKVTYPGQLCSRKVAVKLFRKYEAESHKPIDANIASPLELAGYIRTFNSPIQPYVPEPLGTVTDEKRSRLM